MKTRLIILAILSVVFIAVAYIKSGAENPTEEQSAAPQTTQPATPVPLVPNRKSSQYDIKIK